MFKWIKKFFSKTPVSVVPLPTPYVEKTNIGVATTPEFKFPPSAFVVPPKSSVKLSLVTEQYQKGAKPLGIRGTPGPELHYTRQESVRDVFLTPDRDTSVTDAIIAAGAIYAALRSETVSAEKYESPVETAKSDDSWRSSSYSSPVSSSDSWSSSDSSSSSDSTSMLTSWD